jgi:hypothetical protein
LAKYIVAFQDGILIKSSFQHGSISKTVMTDDAKVPIGDFENTQLELPKTLNASCRHDFGDVYFQHEKLGTYVRIE